ncbi:MAG TPA: hypothetical protein VH682_26890 [Gemmataceae bacterium]|jgi:hypothetical protein
MSESEIPPQLTVSPEAVRLLWEGTRKAVEEWGMDSEDLASLCDIIVRLVDHRLLVLASCEATPASAQVAEKLQSYRQQAMDWLQRARRQPVEPDWNEVAARLQAVGANPLEHQANAEK